MKGFNLNDVDFGKSLITPDSIKAEAERLAAQTGIPENYLINLAEEIPEPEPVVKFSDTPVFTRGNISCISGKAKSRKSFLVGLLSANTIECDAESMVMIFDTEMSKYHTAKNAKRIHRLLEWNERENNDRLRVYSLRELSTMERRECVNAMIEKHRPDLAFIDGIRDLANDFNNIAESSDLVNLLMRLSSQINCHICVVLHENKASDTLRGHLGTEVVNKSETVITVKCDDGNISEVSPAYCRNLPFDKFYFRVNESGLPEHCNPEKKPKSTDKLSSLFSELLPATVTLAYADLRAKLMETAKVKERGAEYKIKQAIDSGIIIKNESGMYHLPIQEAQQNELPF
jgi:hypothetical protein